MIARLQGRVEARDKNALVVAVNGLGLKVLVPTPCAAAAQVGEPVALFTYLHVRENELSLYGCPSEEELSLFEMLLSVSGVGPKLAMSILSAMSADALYLAIGQEQPELLTRVPGVGKRTAEKIVFDLKDKVAAEAGPMELASLTDADTEVIDALTGLGYSIVEAQRAVQSIPREVTTVEERLRMALAYFVRP
ncbi:MAG TPA: Holliday junction branch migration protein RuvA [Anaerolineae bacterium]|jgi:Holliday junction DNA helicase RuvA|nr:Holliday junction branch migration protein RuvA [Anaerolineae bacterium]